MTWGCEAVRQAGPSTLFSAVPTVHTLYCFNWAQKYNWGGELGEKLDQRGAQAQTAASAGSGHRRLEEHIKLLLLLYQVCPCQLEDTGKAGDSAWQLSHSFHFSSAPLIRAQTNNDQRRVNNEWFHLLFQIYLSLLNVAKHCSDWYPQSRLIVWTSLTKRRCRVYPTSVHSSMTDRFNLISLYKANNSGSYLLTVCGRQVKNVQICLK